MANGPGPRVRITDAAQAAGVSKAAVSFAFNRSGRLSHGTVACIRDVAARMDYQPHPPHEGVAGRRLRGYHAALAAVSIAGASVPTPCPPATIEGGEAAFLEAWGRGLRPTGVLCMSDAVAAGVLSAARRIGVRVLEDLSIVGFDDLLLTDSRTRRSPRCTSRCARRARRRR